MIDYDQRGSGQTRFDSGLSGDSAHAVADLEALAHAPAHPERVDKFGVALDVCE